MREPETGKRSVEAAADSAELVGIVADESDVTADATLARQCQRFDTGIEGDDGGCHRSNALGPVAGTTRQLQDSSLCKPQRQPLCEQAQIRLSLRLGIDAVVLLGACRVIGLVVGHGPLSLVATWTLSPQVTSHNVGYQSRRDHPQ